ncbi:hypothetical protein [Streptomyces sp. cg35]|uniref:hypothetical protein n=1 Tax=Streptomyces sp. cg35 TaxID=3421650 RepID=UPI003D17D922
MIGRSSTHWPGPRYDRSVDELVRYALAVLNGWMRLGSIFERVTHRGFGGLPHDTQDLKELGRDGDLRQEPAMMTAARALPRLRQRALVERLDSQERRLKAVGLQRTSHDLPHHDARLAEVLGNMWVAAVLEEIQDPRTRAAAALTYDGYSQEEIRHILDAPSARAIEGLPQCRHDLPVLRQQGNARP